MRQNGAELSQQTITSGSLSFDFDTTGHAAGTYTFDVSGGNISATSSPCEVKGPVPTSVTLAAIADAFVGDIVSRPALTIAPQGAEYASVSWESTTPTIVEIFSDTTHPHSLKMLAAGTGTVKATLMDKDANPIVSGTVNVIVKDLTPVTSISLDGTSATSDILTGYTLPIKVKVIPNDATNQKVDWTSSNTTAIEVVNDPADVNHSDGKATAKAVATGVVITGASNDSPADKVTVTVDVIDAADPDLFLYVQNNIGTQTGWLPVQDSTDKNKWTITNTLSTTGRYMGAFVRKDGSTTNITGAADGLTAVSDHPEIVRVDNVGGHGFQMHPLTKGTAIITITTPSGAGHPTTPIVATLTVTLS